MVYSISIDQKATEEIFEIMDWLDENRPNSTSLFLREMGDCRHRIGRFPLASPIIYPKNIRRMVMPTLPFNIYFRVNQKRKAILIMCIWHQSRSPKALKQRLKS